MRVDLVVITCSLLLVDPVGGFATPRHHLQPSPASVRPQHPSHQPPHFRSHHDRQPLLSEKESDQPKKLNPFAKAAAKFKARPGTYCVIPIVAALVGWITNWMAVQMIFYPIQFRGISLYRIPEVPLGLLGWQGIVPCKTRTMSAAMVDMVTTQLLSVKEVFGQLSPRKCANLLAPRVPMVVQDVLESLPFPGVVASVPGAVYEGLTPVQQSILKVYNRDFLRNLVVDLQRNIEGIFDIQTCVQTQMLQDRAKLGQLFQKCGAKELDFLTNSGLWFGFLLGLIQMVVALFWDNPWSLSIGGLIVGYATNWLALKWIFEPVHPTKVGPWVLQGQFLRRQPEVAKEFSAFFANKILNAQELWKSMLQEPKFHALFGTHFGAFMIKVSKGLLHYTPEPETVAFATKEALSKLPEHVPVLYSYMDDKLNLEATLRKSMELMTSEQFERVLHPIFEEDELTLVLAGAALGFAAGLVQQGFATGQLSLGPLEKFLKKLLRRTNQSARSVWRRIRRKTEAPSEEKDATGDADESVE